MITPHATEAALDQVPARGADQPGVPAGTEAHLLDGSRELVEALRSRLADHDAAAADRSVRMAAELARQEALWSANEAARLQALAAATADYETARTTYEALGSAAAEAMAELYAVSCRAAVLFKAAVRAELAKRAAMPALELAGRTVSGLAGDAPDPVHATPHEFEFGSSDPRFGVAQTALEVFPELRNELTRLRALPQGPAEPAPHPGPKPGANRRAPSTSAAGAEQPEVTPDQLEVIFHRSHAKRRRDDRTRRVTA